MKNSEIFVRAFITALIVLGVGLLVINLCVAFTTEADTSSHVWNWNNPLFLLLMVVVGLLIICVKQLISISKLAEKLRNF